MSRSLLYDELKQDRGISPEGSVFLNIVKTYDWLMGDLTHLLKEHGVSVPKYNVLRILRGAGASGLPSQAIGERMVTRVPDVTRLVDRLEADGYAERERGTEDRRVVTVRIKSAGRSLLSKLDPKVQSLHKKQFRGLTDRDLVKISALLEKARRRRGE